MICTEEDDFVRYQPRWVATLDDGRSVYQDDYRPGEDEPIAWIRLKRYLKETGKKIVGLSIQFCDNIATVAPPNAQGYYYIQGIMNVAGDEDSYSIRFYTLGYVEDNIAHVQKWYIPANIPMPFPAEDRLVSSDDDMVIMNGE